MFFNAVNLWENLQSRENLNQHINFKHTLQFNRLSPRRCICLETYEYDLLNGKNDMTPAMQMIPVHNLTKLTTQRIYRLHQFLHHFSTACINHISLNL